MIWIHHFNKLQNLLNSFGSPSKLKDKSSIELSAAKYLFITVSSIRRNQCMQMERLLKQPSGMHIARRECNISFGGTTINGRWACNYNQRNNQLEEDDENRDWRGVKEFHKWKQERSHREKLGRELGLGLTSRNNLCHLQLFVDHINYN